MTPSFEALSETPVVKGVTGIINRLIVRIHQYKFCVE